MISFSNPRKCFNIRGFLKFLCYGMEFFNNSSLVISIGVLEYIYKLGFWEEWREYVTIEESFLPLNERTPQDALFYTIVRDENNTRQATWKKSITTCIFVHFNSHPNWSFMQLNLRGSHYDMQKLWNGAWWIVSNIKNTQEHLATAYECLSHDIHWFPGSLIFCSF